MGLKDTLLGSDSLQRVRASLTLLALAVYAVFGLVQHGEVLLGFVDARESRLLTAFTLCGALIFYAVIRSGVNLRWAEDPSLTFVQSAFACVSIAAAYAITGPARGAVMSILILILVLVFGLFALPAAQARALAVFAVVLLSAAMFWKSRVDPLRYPVEVEWVHFLFAVTVLSAVTALSIRLGRLRTRLSDRKRDLQDALERIELLAHSDELTGLCNRRRMTARLDEEHARCARSGHPFCVALIDIDHFKRVNDQHGHAGGDEVLRAFAALASAELRESDLLARWGGEEFLLLLSDTPAGLALKGVERLRAKVAASAVDVAGVAVCITVSAGLAEFWPREGTSQLVERADRALYNAKASGRDRAVLA